jgi:predicted DNA-binding transcriptional regulator AlpA
MSSQEFIRYPERKARYGIPYTFEHLCRLCSDGKFPAKVKLSYRCVGWFAADIEAWLAEHHQTATGAKAA